MKQVRAALRAGDKVRSLVRNAKGLDRETVYTVRHDEERGYVYVDGSIGLSHWPAHYFCPVVATRYKWTCPDGACLNPQPYFGVTPEALEDWVEFHEFAWHGIPFAAAS